MSKWTSEEVEAAIDWHCASDALFRSHTASWRSDVVKAALKAHKDQKRNRLMILGISEEEAMEMVDVTVYGNPRWEVSA
jgi:hypothetical protein